MNQSTPPKRQHQVPRMYLKGFVSPAATQKCFWAYSRATCKPSVSSPKTAAWALHANTIWASDGTADNSVEEWFGDLENKCAPVFRDLLTKQILTSDGRWLLSTFLYVQLHRSEVVRRRIQHQAGSVNTTAGGMAYLNAQRERLVEKFGAIAVDDYCDKMNQHGGGIRVSPGHVLKQMILHLGNKPAMFVASDWTIETTDGGSFFVTSDNPVFARRPKHLTDPQFLGIQRYELNCEVGFPLDMRRFLICRPQRQGKLQWRTASPLRCHELNRRTVLSATEYVYSPLIDEGIESLLTQHRGFQFAKN